MPKIEQRNFISFFFVKIDVFSMAPHIDVGVNHYQFKRAKGLSWVRIFYQKKTTDSDGFDSKEQCFHFTSSPQQYSILAEASKYPKNEQGLYEFLLEYPGKAGYNHWMQPEYPFNITTSPVNQTVEGYQNVSVSWTLYHWGGLLLSSNSCAFLDGSTGPQEFWYSICYLKNCGKYGSQFPGNGELANEVILWQRISSIFFHTCQYPIPVLANRAFLALFLFYPIYS